MDLARYIRGKYRDGIRTFCPNCKQWVNVCQNIYGYKFAPVSVLRDFDDPKNVLEITATESTLEDTKFIVEDSDDDYKCGNCANSILQDVRELVESLFTPEVWTTIGEPEGNLVQVMPMVDVDGELTRLDEIEQKYPRGIPGMPDFCYDVVDAGFQRVPVPGGKKDATL